MTREEWIESLEDRNEIVFRITRGCDRCGAYLETEPGKYKCQDQDMEAYCEREHFEWLTGAMDQ